MQNHLETKGQTLSTLPFDSGHPAASPGLVSGLLALGVDRGERLFSRGPDAKPQEFEAQALPHMSHFPTPLGNWGWGCAGTDCD